MKLDKFYEDTIILTISNFATGILRFIFSIILSNKLGAEGVGLYGLIMPVYDLFCCLVCGGLIVAISRKASILYGNKDYKNIILLIKTALIFTFIWSALVCTILFFNMNFITNTIIKDARTIYSLEVICPAVLFVALSSIFKGYFYGISKAKIPAYIDIFEKAVRVLVVIAIIDLLMLKTITKTVTAVYAALSLGEFMSLIFLYLAFVISSRKLKSSYTVHEGRGQLLFDVLIVSIPLCINGFVSSILSAASTLILPRRLVFAGFPYKAALEMIGKFSGMALSITFFPMIIIGSMATVLVPEISQNINQKNRFAVEKRISEVLKISFFLGLATLIICLSIPDLLGRLFYNRNDLGKYIAFSAISLPFSYVSGSTFAILSGIGKQTKILINSVIISIEELILLYVLTGITAINIYGYGITLIITGITAYFLNMHDIRKFCEIHFNLSDIFIDILLSIFLYLILGIMNNIIPDSYFIAKTLSIICAGFILFFISLKTIRRKLR